MDDVAISVIIPALNEAESMGWVVDAIPPGIVDEIVVVDGGSSDHTAEIARAHGCRVIEQLQRGYGRACATGVAAARGEIVVFLDADGADDPGQLADVLAPVVRGQADLSLGSRLAGKMAPGAMPWHQRFGNWLAAWLIRRLYALQVTDLSPFRAVYRQSLLDLGMEQMTYGWPTEMMVKAARSGWRVAEEPVLYRPRLAGRSKISGTLKGTALATYQILTVILRYARV